jgi:hypothetical protein
MVAKPENAECTARAGISSAAHAQFKSQHKGEYAENFILKVEGEAFDRYATTAGF